MDFLSRVKKEMSEGIARAIFEDAGYRVIDAGVEKVFREVACLSPLEYAKLAMPDAVRKLPDFMVMNREQDQKYLIEVKYRDSWSKAVLSEVKDQVALFGEMILLSINASADNPRKFKDSPSRFIRCCALRLNAGVYEMEMRNNRGWEPVDKLDDDAGLWWATWPLWEKFPQLKEDGNSKTLSLAVKTLKGILTE
ncbi:hypothetical protein MSR1_16410 [Magnetospirillum gryphiswaldense MSR-1]|uniref:Uncharacterized protein n=3 Tax=Magnetospirillum gryphiswaldense TaxID=55518 RepID=V6F0C0_MAGGM|nr:hypothetical protein MSR1_16410 [Magnetospirillum gryphiswaldense MSR-1]AVM78036.1 hypothetical protein MSR1L_16410 [Magnetospirillum gryphiswaldense]CAM77076.1 hypothetical protein MGR_3579 [Magnetospirillum gryphiswaldense MSR-1]CDK97938.1 conserved protein of unknown function [Magnetospirillum gryphiswaldense MSR-1 v2]